ncbi:MAG: hypothetical protein ACRCYX_15560 [Dermatophilaceae bacterium]
MPGRADLGKHHVAEPVAGINEPALPHKDVRPEVHPVEVELAAAVCLVIHPPQHVLDRSLVRADVERLRALARLPTGDMLVTAHPHAGLRSEDRRRVEVHLRPVLLGARVVPGELSDPILVKRWVVEINGHPGRVLVLAGQAAAGALLSALLPTVNPSQADDEPAPAASAQHVPLTREIDGPFHASILSMDRL